MKSALTDLFKNKPTIDVKAKVEDLSRLESKRSTINTVKAVKIMIISGKIGIKSFKLINSILLICKFPNL